MIISVGVETLLTLVADRSLSIRVFASCLVQPEFLTSASQVRHFLSLMEKACSPLKKLEHLLGAMTTLNNSVSCFNLPHIRKVP